VTRLARVATLFALLSITAVSATAGTPAGATAQCNDGTYSYSLHHSGTCSHHGGVSEWLDGTSATTSSTNSGDANANAHLAAALPNAKVAYYDTRTTVSRISSPPSGLAPGLVSGWQTTYRDKGAGQPWATVRLYLYSATGDAEGAFAASCPASRCSKSTTGAKAGIDMRFRAPKATRGRCLKLSSRRTRILVIVDTCAVTNGKGKPYTLAGLKYDASFLAGFTQAHAVPYG
jgi:hypothetical protein